MERNQCCVKEKHKKNVIHNTDKCICEIPEVPQLDFNKLLKHTTDASPVASSSGPPAELCHQPQLHRIDRREYKIVAFTFGLKKLLALLGEKKIKQEDEDVL